MISRTRFHRGARACLGFLVAVLSTGCQYLPGNPTASATPASAPVGALSASPTPSPSPTATPFDPNTLQPMSPLAQNRRVPVIMYHDIVAEKGRDSVWFDCSRKEFEEQIAFLEQEGATFLSLDQLHRHLTQGEEIPPNSVVLTFDDNYQGFYDNAYPLLKEKGIPSAVFVHTNFVGDKKGAHPKMDWETLRELDASGLVTIGSHTLSHPEDMAKLPIEEQEREMTESRAILESQLGHPVPYFAYPNGTGDKETFAAAERVGYTMAFTIVNGPAEESPGILRVCRYIHTRLEKAWKDSQEATRNAPADIVRKELLSASIVLQVEEFDGIKLGIVRGGRPSTWRSPQGRFSVGEFLRRAAASGKLSETPVGGMNGTFFADAALRGTDNTMIGPCLTREDAVFYPETDPTRLPKLRNRPLVLIGPTAMVILPFNPDTMNDEPTLRSVLPDLTDVFLAGAWIVHNGEPRTKEEMQAYSARDFNDPRRRACFGVTDSGDVMLVGSLEVITTEQLARAAAAAGIKEAVLMDSGFSTSIVYDGKIIVTGHTARHLPSRAVPHAIVVEGATEPPTDAATVEHLSKADDAVGSVSAMEAQANAPRPGSGRRRR
ncbi:MAG: polysaccharide deacetylase family protein [Capsulimonadales bacterium]|nr:polysaccharide deacetylase family protein [Capsulimonadales bacterium]